MTVEGAWARLAPGGFEFGHGAGAFFPAEDFVAVELPGVVGTVFDAFAVAIEPMVEGNRASQTDPSTVVEVQVPVDK